MSFIRRQFIEVVDYDPAWPTLFEEIRARIELLLLGLVTEIHHIGSTSVPGLRAKPKIDIDIIFRQPAEIPEGIARMQATGDYTFHGELYQDNRWVFTTSQVSPGQRLYLSAPEHPAHLHPLSRLPAPPSRGGSNLCYLETKAGGRGDQRLGPLHGGQGAFCHRHREPSNGRELFENRALS